MHTVRSLLLVSLCLLTTLWSNARADEKNLYANFQLAYAMSTGYNASPSLVTSIGLPMNSFDTGFAIEAEISTTLTPALRTVAGDSQKLSYSTLAAYGVYLHPLSNDTILRGRLGLLYETLSIVAPLDTVESSATGVSGGIGLLLRNSPHLDSIVELTVVEAGIVHLNYGVQYRF